MLKSLFPTARSRYLFFQVILLLAFVALYILFIPYLTYGVIKEQQHYLNVSWHLWTSSQWVLLHSDAGIYINKPPLLFWLTGLAWGVLGVHNWILRAIPAFFSISSVFLLFVLFSQLWPKLKSYAWIAPLLFLFNWYVWHYVPLYMHDFLLMAFIILSLNALVLARQYAVLGFGLFGLAMALGLLAKGPVMLVFCVPAALLAPLSFDRNRYTLSRWYGGFVFSVVVMLLLLAIWLVPFWHQIQSHHLEESLMIKLFGGHHQYTRKPIWNYLAVLPPMLLPWLIWPALYRAIHLTWREKKSDRNLQWMLASFFVVFIVMSVIGAKADRYIMPIAIYFSLCAAYFIACADQAKSSSIHWQAYPLWMVCFIFSIALMLLSPFLPKMLHSYANYTAMPFAFFGMVLFVFSGWMLRLKQMTLSTALLMQASLMFLFYSGFALIVVRTDMRSHHLARLEKIANAIVQQGRPLAYQYAYGGYRYRVGKGMMPNGVILKNDQAVKAWLEKHKTGIVIAKVARQDQPEHLILTVPFDREKKVVLTSHNAPAYGRKLARTANFE